MNVVQDYTLPEDARLIAVFPLNGHIESGYRIYIINEGGGPATDQFVAQIDSEGVATIHDTLAGAIRLCLANSGWGDYKLREVT